MTASYTEALAERFPSPATVTAEHLPTWEEVAAEDSAAREQDRPVSYLTLHPDCQARRHHNRKARGRGGCICEDQVLMAAYRQADAERKRLAYQKRANGIPSLIGVDRVAAEMLAAGLEVPGAGKAEKRLAACLMRRNTDLTVPEIARRLDCTDRTVRRYIGGRHGKPLKLTSRGRIKTAV